MIKIIVHARWDEIAGVWVAVSDDVPGLTVEAETTDELEKELKVVIPMLLAMNGNDAPLNVPVELLQTSTFTANAM